MTQPCPTCSGPSRETVGMVCQTCSTNYGPPADLPALPANAELRACLTCGAVVAAKLAQFHTDRHGATSDEAIRSARRLDELEHRLAAFDRLVNQPYAGTGPFAQLDQQP